MELEGCSLPLGEDHCSGLVAEPALPSRVHHHRWHGRPS
jgi:hypothetical protein